MRGRARRPVPETARTTARAVARPWWRRVERGERGDTLIEILIALMILAIAALALITAFTTSIAASAEHRRLASNDTVLALASQEVIAGMQSNASLFTDACSSPLASFIQQYPLWNGASLSDQQGFVLPAPYVGKNNQTGYDVQYDPTTPVQYWNGVGFQTGCVPGAAQMVKLDLVGTGLTNSFVVDYPVGSAVATASGPAAQLIFLTSPGCGSTGCYAGSPFPVQPVVEVADANGVAVSTDLSPVVLSIDPSSQSSGVLSGCVGNEILGVVTFSGCTLGSGGANYVIEASDGALTPAHSNPFDVAAANFQLVFTAQPVAGKAGSPFATAPSVSVENLSGQVNTSWQGTITFTSSGGQFAGCTSNIQNATTLTVPVAGGVATVPATCDFWGGYFYNPASSPPTTATQYTMTATAQPAAGSEVATPATSTTFSVSGPGPAYQLAFVQSPGGAAGNQPTTAFTPQPVVEVQDQYGNVVTSVSSADTAVTLTMQKGSTAEALQGCSSSISYGDFRYSGCHGTAYNTGLTLAATGTETPSGGARYTLVPATSSTFNITGLASQLLFQTSPQAGASLSALPVQPVLVYEDASGNVVTSETAPITLSVSPSPNSLTNCTNLVPNGGYVKVANCVFGGVVGTPYTMTATGGGLTSPPSDPFSPTGPGPATQLVFTTQPVAGAADAVLTTQPVVTVEDAFGNVVTTATNVITLTSSGNSQLANCAGLTVIGGSSLVSNCTFGGVVGTPYQITATSGTLTPAVSANISPTGPGPLYAITLNANVSAFTATAKAALTATLTDNFGNVETTDSTTPVTFSALPASTGAVSGLGPVTDAGGIAVDTVTGTTPGSVTFVATANSITSNQLTLTVNGPPSISTTSLPSATLGGRYSQGVQATGGTGTLTFTETGSLPGGLTMSSSGLISGTVNANDTVGSYPFSVTVTDADGVSATAPLSITVVKAATITTTSFATGTAGESNYSQGAAATGGTPPYSWSATNLPGGLTMSSSGQVTGTILPSDQATTYTVGLTLTDADGVVTNATATLVVNAAPALSPTSVPSVTQGGHYSQSLAATGGTGSLTISETGRLPGGLNWSATSSSALISGTASTSDTVGNYPFSVTVTDSLGVSTTTDYTLAVVGAPVVTPATLPAATLTGAYHDTLAATGGTPGSPNPYTWSLASGTLPGGLTLDPSTGRVSGTATGTDATGAYPFSVTVTDADGVTSAPQSFSITVNPAPAIATTSLAAIDDSESSYAQTLAVTTGTGTGPFTWSASGFPAGSGLSVSPTGTIAQSSPDSATPGTYPIAITVTDANGVTATTTLNLTVNTAPTIAPTTLPGATAQTAYSQALSASGGAGGFTGWTATGLSGSGITLVGSGSSATLSATKVTLAPGSYAVSVQVTDALGVTTTNTYTLVVAAPPTITPQSLPSTSDGASYDQTITTTGGTAPLSWTVVSGALPSGLTFTPTGTTDVISGTVSATAPQGTYTVTLTVTDTNHVTSAPQSFSLVVTPPLSVTTTTLPSAEQGATYQTSVQATGGNGSYSWTASNLPSGLSMSPSGVISGTIANADAATTYPVTVTVTSGASSAQATLDLTVTQGPTLTYSVAPQQQVNRYNDQVTITFNASGGTGTYYWTESDSGFNNNQYLSFTSSGATATFTGRIRIGRAGTVTVTINDGNATYTAVVSVTGQ